MNTSTTPPVAAPVVQTAAGQLRGECLGRVNRFLGIRYAQGISGVNRFAPPRPVEPWTGVRDALRYASSAPQQETFLNTPVTPAFAPPDYVGTGDDCLALNVWTPANDARDLPVMVWLHGGGWISGSGSCTIYDGANLAGRGDVVVVTINHRLGASGLTDFSRVVGGTFAGSSNLGIRDIVAALEWVRDNIAAFGGNPDLVTIFGESGGGWKVATMLSVPSAKGLFHRAVIQSGPLTRFATRDEADHMARAVLAALDIPPGDAEALDRLSWEQVVAAEAKVLADNPMSMRAMGFPGGFWPVIDGDLLSAHAFEPSASASSLDVPLMLGQTGTEMTLFMMRDTAAYALDEAQLEQRVVGMMGAGDTPAVLFAYRRDFPDADPSELWFRILSDASMGVISTAVLDARAVPGSAPVYAFRFEWQTPIADGKIFSPHTIEIPFVFDNSQEPAGVAMTGGGAEVASLAKQVSSAWIAFAKTGAPSAKALPAWPVYTSTDRESLHIDTTSRVAPFMDSATVELMHEKLWAAAERHGTG